MLILVVCLYLLSLFIISFLSSKNSNLQDYFNGSKKASWLLISFGMISDTLSGVTYISVPGSVVTTGTTYLFVSLGYVVGNVILSFFILPHFFKHKILSIYEVLTSKLGREATLICSFLFLTARSFGSAARLFLSLTALYQIFSLSNVISFPWICILTVFIIYMYTLKGGIKSLIVTDVFHSTLLLLGFFSIVFFLTENIDIKGHLSQVPLALNTTRWLETNHIFKAFIGGIFVTLAMYGLDQNMMQKCLSCPNLKSAQKNILSSTFFSLILNLSFVLIGLLILPNYEYFNLTLPMTTEGTIKADELLIFLLQSIAPEWIFSLFILGLIAATFSSSDAAITTLTTSFYQDILHEKYHSKVKVKFIHAMMGFLIVSQLLLISFIDSKSMISFILKVSTYMYAPLLGIFCLFLLNFRRPRKGQLIFSTMATLTLSYPIMNSIQNLTHYQFGLELLFFNSLLFLFFNKISNIFYSK
jgi:SSS family solute:Na+ symporter